MPVAGLGSTCPLQEMDGFCDVATGVRCSQVSTCPNLSGDGCAEWGISSSPAAPVHPPPQPASDSPPSAHKDLDRKKEEWKVEKIAYQAKREGLLNVLLWVLIVLIPVVAVFLIVYASVTGSTVPLGGLVTIVGAAISYAVWLFRGGGGDSGASWGA